jgi:hypothetical protein
VGVGETDAIGVDVADGIAATGVGGLAVIGVRFDDSSATVAGFVDEVIPGLGLHATSKMIQKTDGTILLEDIFNRNLRQGADYNLRKIKKCIVLF